MRQSRYRTHKRNNKADTSERRIKVLRIIASVVFAIIIVRLFQLQVLRHSLYADLARNQHYNTVELPAKRGDIYVKDSNSGELIKLATNTTLDLVYIDPKVAEDKIEITEKLTPLIFPEEEYEGCKENPKSCFYSIVKNDSENETIINESRSDEPTEPDEDTADLEFKSYSQMLNEISSKTLEDISKTKIDFVVLKRDASDEIIEGIKSEDLTGVFINEDNFLIYADPTLIPPGELSRTASILANYLDDSVNDIEYNLSLRDTRYVFLKNRLRPEISDEIRALDLPGVVLIPEHWRFYPEGNLASQIVGFVSRENVGQYGIEGYFNVELEGKKGSITAESDPTGRQVTVGNTEIINAVDGDSIVLTIDRVVQKKVEEILAEQVENFNADSGQVIIMNPYTGAIIAMANYPSFDPNVYTKSLELTKLTQKEAEEAFKTTLLFKKDERNKYVEIEPGDREDEEVDKYAYANRLGPGVFKNKVISDFYEPGSAFKPIVMAIGLDAGEVTPNTTYNDTGKVKSGEFTIQNSDKSAHGITTMTQVLEKSLNTGMIFVIRQLGEKLAYEYLKDFGVGEYTNIQLEGETQASFPHYNTWDNDTKLLTISYGQGIVVTPLQMISAWAALANGGNLVRPYVVDSVMKGDEIIETKPEIIQRVISQESSVLITSMLTSVVKRGHGKDTYMPNYSIAGKTGTAQIAGRGGYEEGDGSTITSFAGYFPASHPEFVMLVKFDRPRIGYDQTWGSTTAVPTFRMITEFLIDHYNIPPDS